MGPKSGGSPPSEQEEREKIMAKAVARERRDLFISTI
jgi:hypothetical protein